MKQNGQKISAYSQKHTKTTVPRQTDVPFTMKKLALLLVACLPLSALAQTNATVSYGQTVTSTVGTGRNDNNGYVFVDSGGKIETQNANAISLGDNATISIIGTVINHATNNTGHYGTGANTIEVNSHSNITIEAGGQVISAGNENIAEAINVHGYGNVITIQSFALVQSSAGAAIWFQDWTSAPDASQRNQVINRGTVRQTNGGNVIGTSAGAGIIFTNWVGGVVEGNLVFSNGNDDLYLHAGSVITGNIDGGGGINTLTLSGSSGPDPANGGYLPGALKNFSSLIKIDNGVWTITGPMQGFNSVLVKQGTLALTGNNSGFTGSVTVDSGATLEARAQSLPTRATGNNANNVLNNGQVLFTQPDDGTYIGQITGSGSVTKTGAGTLTLAPETGANTYSGGTSIQGGTVAVATDSALGAPSGALSLNGGTLQWNNSFDLAASRAITLGPLGGTFDTQDFYSTITQNITGSGDLYKTGTYGTLVLNGNNTYSGGTYIYGGTLQVNNNSASNMTGQVFVFQNARLEGVGTLGSTSYATHNAGTISPGVGSTPSGVLTIRGDYAGQPGGIVQINTALGNDNSPTSRLVITGGTDGYTAPNGVKVINRGGLGGRTAEGIRIIEVQDTAHSSSSAFRLVGDYVMPTGVPVVIGGTQIYALHQGSTSNPQDGNWYLRNYVPPGIIDFPSIPGLPAKRHPSTYQPGVALYEAYPQILAALNRLPTLQQRVGNRFWPSGSSTDASSPNTMRYTDKTGIWVRVEGSTATYKPSLSTSETDYDIDTWRLRMGVDGVLHTTDDGSVLIGGINVHYGYAKADVSAVTSDGSIRTDGYGIAGTLTWYDQNGFYADAQAQLSWFDSDIHSHTLHADEIKGNDAYGYALGIETGKLFELSPQWSLTPQVQFVYSSTRFNNFTDPFSTQVSRKDSDSLLGRLGLAINHEDSWTASNGKIDRLKLYGIANLYYEFLDGTKVQISGEEFESRNDRLWGGLSLGGSYNWNDDQYSLYSELGARTSLRNFGDSYEAYGEIGFRMKF